MPAITPFEETPPTLEDRVNFNGRADHLFGTEIPRMIGEVNDLEASLRAAATAGLPYTISTTIGGDPTPGRIRFNNAAQNAATGLGFDILDVLGIDRTALFNWAAGSTNPAKGLITIMAPGDASRMLQYAYTALVDSTGYFSATVTCVGYSSASPFADGDDVVAWFDRAGNLGATGAFASWTQIGSTLNISGSPTSLTLSSIPQTYSDLLLEIDATVSAPASIYLDFFSGSTASWSGPVLLQGASVVSHRGPIVVFGYRLDHQLAISAIEQLGSTPPIAAAITAPHHVGTKVPGGITGLRVSTSGQTYLAGTLKLFGK